MSFLLRQSGKQPLMQSPENTNSQSMGTHTKFFNQLGEISKSFEDRAVKDRRKLGYQSAPSIAKK